MNELKKKFSKTVRMLMLRNDISTETLALRLGLSKSTIYAILNSKNSPTIKTLESWAEALGVTLTEFVSEIENQNV